MYEKIAKKITDSFIRKNIIKKEDEQIYEYSYEVLISQSVYILIMIFISILFKAFFETLIFFLGFYICRSLTGGYHASNYIKCHLLFALNQIVFLLLLLLMPNRCFCIITFIALLISIIIILTVGPVDNPNKPFEEREYLKFRNKSRVFAFTLSLIASFLFLFGKNNVYCFSFSIGILSVSISLLYAFIERRFSNEKN